MTAGRLLDLPTGPRTRSRPLPLLGAVGLVPIAGLMVGQAMVLQRRYQEAPGLPPVDCTLAPRGADGGSPLELATFGDSAMAGVGVSAIEDGLPVQLARRLADATGRSVHVTGYARSGARTRDVLDRQVPRVTRTPDVAVLVVGTNDVTHVTRPSELARTSRELLDAFGRLGVPLVMSGLPEFRAMRLLPHPLMEAALAYGALVGAVQERAAAARPSVRFVDVAAAVGREFVSDGRTMSADAFHPSPVGYGRIADALLPAVVDAVGTAAVRGATS